jgi:tRNA-splicing ligase RtcB
MNPEALVKISNDIWEIPKSGNMLVSGRIFASEKLLREMDEKVYEQVSNVACLPGIQKFSAAMPDAHWGYGFPIGGVAAFDPDEGGVVSVGGVGFDVNCGVRTLKTDLSIDDVKPKLSTLVDTLFKMVPAGLGSRGEITLAGGKIHDVLTEGAPWVVEQGYGIEEDLEFIEEGGVIAGADPSSVSETAIKREKRQVGTLGSGNHYLEIQYIDEVYHQRIAEQFGLSAGQVVISLHCGSRALGHQIGTDYLKTLASASRKYGIPIREKELVCAPIHSPEGEKYFSAVNCAINYAFANRQVIAHLVREGVKKVFPDAEVSMLYDIGHNTCKVERHVVDGRMKTLYVHRKGATRAFGPQRKELPRIYQDTGQPVIIGGSMGTASYILAGLEKEEGAFASVCHGAGRVMSRKQAKKTWRGEELIKELNNRGIIVRAHSMPGVAEEAPGSYKPVEEVVDVIDGIGLAAKIVRLRPLGCIKG